jgi:hypothetical protein
MSRLKQIMLETAMMMGLADSGNNVYMDKNPSCGMKFNPNYRPKTQHRELREFTVKGKKVMAYSKKDAITRLKHSK